MSDLDSFFKPRGVPERTAKDTIEMLREFEESGEAMLDVGMSAYGFLLPVDKKLAKEWNRAYSEYFNGDIEELPDGLLDRVEKAIL